jgi:hypothetical protein
MFVSPVQMPMPSSVEATQTKFIAWLGQHYADVENGSASFDGVRVTRDSVVARYYCCCSFLFYVARQISGCVLEGTSEATQTRVRSTIITATLGCLGLGIFMVPFYLFKNIAGGERMTVGDLLDNTAKVNKSVNEFEFGPAQIIIGICCLFAIAALALQGLIFIRKHTGQ